MKKKFIKPVVELNTIFSTNIICASTENPTKNPGSDQIHVDGPKGPFDARKGTFIEDIINS